MRYTAENGTVYLFFFCQEEHFIEFFKFRNSNDFSKMECDAICFSLSKQLQATLVHIDSDERTSKE